MIFRSASAKLLAVQQAVLLFNVSRLRIMKEVTGRYTHGEVTFVPQFFL